VNGVSTEADFVQSLRENGKLSSDSYFNSYLINLKQTWWPSDTLPKFPELGEKEATTCQGMVDEVVKQLLNYRAHRVKRLGSGFVKDSTTVPQLNTIISASRIVSFSQRKPDLVMYQAERSGACAITMLGDVKGRTSNQDFPDSETGHILDMTRVLMTKHQYLRYFIICFLTDGYRFQYFKCSRDANSFFYRASSVFLGVTGWQVFLLSY